MQPHQQPEVAQLAARCYFEELDHPVLSRLRYSTLPMRFSGGPHRRQLRPAPLLGEHNAELLGELGLSAEDVALLEADGVIGRDVAPAGVF